MARLIPAILGLRRDPRLLKLPPYLSLLCILTGIIWLLVLPLDEYSRRTYISENALLPAQVHTYFGGSEHTVFRAYRHEVSVLSWASNADAAQRLGDIFRDQGLKVGRQRYFYETAEGKYVEGENVYAILQGPRADATEAVVLMAALRNMDGVMNQSGVSLILTMARYMKRWSLWSKDVIFLITQDSTTGPQAWVDAYHDAHGPTVDSLPIKSGALQGAVAIDYPAGPEGHRFEKMLVHYDGINGQLPNLDLVNTVVKIAKDQASIDSFIQRKQYNSHSYKDRLDTLFQGIITQGRGVATGPHSCFIPYHVDAVTLQTWGDGWHDEMSMGRVIEGTFRSLNNLLEHLHQSFFFYLLMQEDRFVSIGTYLPSAMLIAVNFSITSIALWIFSGRSESTPKPVEQEVNEANPKDMTVVQHNNSIAAVPVRILQTDERRMFLPTVFVAAVYAAGLIPLYIITTSTEENMVSSFFKIMLASAVLPYVAAFLLQGAHMQELTLISCFSLLILGIVLSTLSTLNFSLGLLIGLLAAPASFVRPMKGLPQVSLAISLAMQLVSPCMALLMVAAIPNGVWTRGYQAVDWKLRDYLSNSVHGMKVNGVWTMVVICVVWWPAWVIATFTSASGLFPQRTVNIITLPKPKALQVDAQDSEEK